MVHHFLRMKVCQLVDLQEHTSSFLINIRASLIINIRAALSRIAFGKTPRYNGQVHRGFSSFSFFSLSHKEDRSRGPTQARTTWYAYEWGCRRFSKLVAGPPPSTSSSRQCRDISNFPGAQGSLSKVDSNTLMIRKVQKEHVPKTESDCKTRSNFRALFYRVSRAFGCDQNVHVALVTRGARRSTRNLPYVTITHS